MIECVCVFEHVQPEYFNVWLNRVILGERDPSYAYFLLQSQIVDKSKSFINKNNEYTLLQECLLKIMKKLYT